MKTYIISSILIEAGLLLMLILAQHKIEVLKIEIHGKDIILSNLNVKMSNLISENNKLQKNIQEILQRQEIYDRKVNH